MLLILSNYSNGPFLRVPGDFCGVSKTTESKTIKSFSCNSFTKVTVYQYINSTLYRCFETGHFGSGLLIGDSRYPLTPYLVTPLLQTNTEGERLFNESLIMTKNTGKRAYGVWKRRFAALAMGIRLNIDVRLSAIVASAILHNMACDERDSVPLVSDLEKEAIVQSNNIFDGALPAVGAISELNSLARLNLINKYSRL
nr:unnamed protein product [Callosobruchus analis]